MRLLAKSNTARRKRPSLKSADLLVGIRSWRPAGRGTVRQQRPGRWAGHIDKSCDSSGSDNRGEATNRARTRASFRMMLEQRMTRPVPILMSWDSREDERLILEFLYRKFFQVSFFAYLLDGHHRGRLWRAVTLDRMRPLHNYRSSHYSECWKCNAFHECRKCDALHGMSPLSSI